METHYGRSTAQSATADEHDVLLECRLTTLGLDHCTMERDYGETFDKIKGRCMNCGLRMSCAADLTRYPRNLVWEAYCPNSGTLNALVAVTEALAVVRTPG